MIEGIMQAASGLEAYSKNQEVIATNLANASTYGYKRNIVDFDAELATIGGVKQTTKLKANVSIDYTKGNLIYTGNKLDIAIDGDGFFSIETEDGPKYTRNGQFQLSGMGEIITHDGGKLMGVGGNLIIPPGSSDIKIDSHGVMTAGGKAVGQILVNMFANMSKLKPIGNSMFNAPSEAEIEEVPDAKIAQGYLEKSNINVIVEMVNMIQNMRSYEASNKIMKSLGNAVKQLINTQSNIG